MLIGIHIKTLHIQLCHPELKRGPLDLCFSVLSEEVMTGWTVGAWDCSLSDELSRAGICRGTSVRMLSYGIPAVQESLESRLEVYW